MASAVIALAIASRASADQTSKLAYVRAPGAESCADEAELRREVAIRLGYDPFRPFASTTLDVQVMRDKDRGFRGRVVLADEGGVQRGAREIASRGDDCRDLTGALALTMSLAVDPASAMRPPPPAAAPAPAPAPAPEEAPPRAPETVPPPSAPPADRPRAPTPARPESTRRFGLGLGGHGAFGIAPAPAVSGRLSFELAERRFGAVVEARFDLPSASDAEVQGGRVRTSLVAGTAAPCLRAGVAAFCGVVTVGRLLAESIEIASPRSDAFVFVGAGARATLDLELPESLVLRGGGELLGHLTPFDLALNGRSVFELPPVSGTLGVGLHRFF